MKRALSLSFLLFANVILLAHAVIPHHYHNQIPDISWGSIHKNDETHTSNQCIDPNCPIHGVEEDCFLEKLGVRFDSNGQILSSIDAEFGKITRKNSCLRSRFSECFHRGATDFVRFRRLSFGRIYNSRFVFAQFPHIRI